MSDDASFDQNWWLTAKAQSLSRRTRLSPSGPSANPGDAFLIVTEGEVTEPVYFDLVLADLQLSAVRIRVQPGDASDPRHVILTAERLAKEQLRKARKGSLGINEPGRFDHVWAVVDTDVAVRNDFWNDVRQLAEARGVKLAHSTPCFEFWLLLHVAGFTTRADLVDGDAAKRAVKEALDRDYSTNEQVARAVFPAFVPNWPQAVVHAGRVRRHHEDAGTAPPANPSTEMDHLLRALNDSAPAHLRKLKV